MLSQQTIYQFQQGDEQAFRKLYDHFCKKLYWFAYRYVQNREQAEEITADQFVKLWHKRKDFKTLQDIICFLKACTRNACLDKIRSRNSKTKQFQQWLLYQMRQEVFIDDIKEVRQEVWNEITKAAMHLPMGARKVFQLHYIQGMRLGEISVMLNINESTVYNQKFRIVAKLRELFEHQKSPFGE